VYRIALLITEQIKALAGVDPVDATAMSNDDPIVTGPLTFDLPTYILGAGLGPIPVEGACSIYPAPRKRPGTITFLIITRARHGWWLPPPMATQI